MVRSIANQECIHLIIINIGKPAFDTVAAADRTYKRIGGDNALRPPRGVKASLEVGYCSIGYEPQKESWKQFSMYTVCTVNSNVEVENFDTKFQI